MNYVIYKIDNNRMIIGRQDYHIYVAATNHTQYLTSRLSEALFYTTAYAANYAMVRNNMNNWAIKHISDKDVFKAKLANE